MCCNLTDFDTGVDIGPHRRVRFGVSGQRQPKGARYVRRSSSQRNTQHELTAGEIARDKGRQRGIDRNRAAGAVKRKKHDVNAVTIVHVADPASDPQKVLIQSLLKDLSMLDETTWMQAATWWLGGGGTTGAVETANKALASQTIERLKIRITEAKAKPAGVATPRPLPTYASAVGATFASLAPVYTPRDKFADIRDGYYAVNNNDDVLAFYRVSTWEKSGDRKVQVHASDALHLVRGHKATDAILMKIRKMTPLVSGKLFAWKIGSCYRCGRTLTDEESRAAGIGPVCAGKE